MQQQLTSREKLASFCTFRDVAPPMPGSTCCNHPAPIVPSRSSSRGTRFQSCRASNHRRQECNHIHRLNSGSPLATPGSLASPSSLTTRHLPSPTLRQRAQVRPGSSPAGYCLLPTTELRKTERGHDLNEPPAPFSMSPKNGNGSALPSNNCTQGTGIILRHHSTGEVRGTTCLAGMLIAPQASDPRFTCFAPEQVPYP